MLKTELSRYFNYTSDFPVYHAGILSNVLVKELTVKNKIYSTLNHTKPGHYLLLDYFTYNHFSIEYFKEYVTDLLKKEKLRGYLIFNVNYNPYSIYEFLETKLTYQVRDSHILRSYYEPINNKDTIYMYLNN